jgi:hypothetical protein
MDHEREWRKSRRSNAQSFCVELSVASTWTGVRDTKNRDAGTLTFSSVTWAAFLSVVKSS